MRKSERGRMFGRGGTTARMRGRNDGGAQKRRVLVTVCTLVLMFSLISLYHGSFFSNRSNKLAVEDTFDPSASGWSANLAAGTKDQSAKSNAVKTGADVSSAVRGGVDVKADEEPGAEKDVFSEKIDANDEESVSGGDSPKVFTVSAADSGSCQDS